MKCALILALTLAAPRTARAQADDQSSPPQPAPSPAPAPSPPGAEVDAAAPAEPAPLAQEAPARDQEPPAPEPAPRTHRDYELELGARVFVRDTLTRVDLGDDAAWTHDRDVDQARVFANYDRKMLRIAVEVELAGTPTIKDTFIRLKPGRAVRMQAGRFKAPMSFLGLESKWSLPSVERGVLSDITQDDRGLPFVGGRGDGVEIDLRPPVPLDPRFTAAAFQSPLTAGSTAIDPTEHFTQDLYARAEIEPVPGLHAAVAFGLVGYTARAGDPSSVEHIPMGSLELFAETSWLRAWLEGFAGESFYYQPDLTTIGHFAAARALVAPRIRRPFCMWRIEPYALASWFEPSDDAGSDQVTELGGGINAAFSKHWRLQLESVQRVAQGVASPVADSTVVRLQLGAAFAETLQ